MRVRRMAAGLAAAMVVASGASMAAAPAALAADYDAACASSSSTLSVSGQVGDTITVQLVSADCYPESSSAGVVSWVADYATTPAQNPAAVCHNVDCNGTNPETVITITLEQAGTTTWTALQNSDGLTLNITVAPSDVYVPIPPWIQGYGRGGPADACRDGWSPSWEMWPNGGRGGYVCTRSIPSLG